MIMQLSSFLRDPTVICVILRNRSLAADNSLVCVIVQSKLRPAKRDAEAIGEAVRRSRRALGLRQDELALAAGVSTRSIHQIEHGKPTSRLDSLSPVLEVLGLRLQVEPVSPADEGR
jgi:HTH-type transcriptional regulator/antitoxin HipB